jgi:hypothetical protein
MQRAQQFICLVSHHLAAIAWRHPLADCFKRVCDARPVIVHVTVASAERSFFQS